jgi:hypothetical protein
MRLVEGPFPTIRGFTLRVQRNRGSARFDVRGDGKGLTSRSGVAAVRELADRIGLTTALSAAARPSCPPGLLHDPGAVLRDLIVTLVDGGDDFSAIEVLRGQAKLVGEVASDSTAWRRVKNLADDELALARLDEARLAARTAAWGAGAVPVAVADPESGPLCIDIDATLVTAHSDKQQAAGTYKGGFGFHPLLAYLDRGDSTGEALAGLLRAGNAGANSAADHKEVFDTALAQLPPLPEETRLLVRADSAGASKEFLWYLRDAHVGFSVGVRLSPQFQAAIRVLHAHVSVWEPALTQDGAVRDGAHVAEATGMVDLSDYPPGTRLLVRREPRHPGAQLTFDDIDGHRFTALLTDQHDADLALLDKRHRAHARVEQRIEAGKDTGMANLPSADFAVNEIWLQLVLAAQDLFAFFAALALDGDLAAAEPKTIRYRLLHVAGRITTSGRQPTLHVDRDWPWLDQLLAAFTRIRAIPLLA